MKRDKRRGKSYPNAYCKNCESKRRYYRTQQARLMKQGKIKLPIEPLADHIRRIMDTGRTMENIAFTIGVDESRVRAILKGAQGSRGKTIPYKTVTLDLADEVMVALGGAFSVYDVYPQLRGS
jgi:hypothetical protein